MKICREILKIALPTSEIAAYESTGVTVDTDLSIEWNWKIMTGMILGIFRSFPFDINSASRQNN